MVIFSLFSVIGFVGFLFNLIDGKFQNDDISLFFARRLSIQGFIENIPLLVTYQLFHVINLFFILLYSKICLQRQISKLENDIDGRNNTASDFTIFAQFLPIDMSED